MKTTKRLLSCLLVLAMLFALAIPAFAAGSKTITVQNTKSNATYTLYKLFDAVTNDAGTSYTVPAGKELAENAFFKEEAGHVVPVGTVNAADEATKAWFLAQVGGFATKQGDTQTGGNNLTWSVDEGYYFLVKEVEVDGVMTSIVVSIDTVGQDNITLTDKNATSDKPGEPDPDKGYKYVTGGANNGNVVMAAVGESLPFTVSFKTVNFVAKVNDKGEVVKDDNGDVVMVPVTEYTIQDLPDGMDVDFMTAGDKLVVKVGGTKIANYNIVDEHTITIPWVDDQGAALYADPSSISVEYEGKVNRLGTEENPVKNDVTLTYKTGDGATTTIPDPDPTEPEVKVYTGVVNVYKYDGLNKGDQISAEEKKANPLSGAEFILYKGTAENPEYLKITKNDKGEVTNIEWVSDREQATREKSDAEGKLTFAGLGAGTYTLVEVEAPAGYNGVAEDAIDPVTTELEVKTNANVTTYTVTAGYAEVANNTGAQLPSTGGIGTTLFYVIGGLMVCAAVVVLVSKKRMSAEQ